MRIKRTGTVTYLIVREKSSTLDHERFYPSLKSSRFVLSELSIEPDDQTNVLRLDKVRPVKGAFFSEKEASTLEFYIEYLQVKEAYTEEYSQIMTETMGPAMAEMIEHQHGVFDFRAYEVFERLIDDPTLPDWNQVHFNGFDPSMAIDQIIQTFGVVLQKIHPEGLSYFAIKKQLREWCDLVELQHTSCIT